MTEQTILGAPEKFSSVIRYNIPLRDNDRIHNIKILEEIAQEKGVFQELKREGEECTISIDSSNCLDCEEDGWILCSPGVQSGLGLALHVHQQSLPLFEEQVQIEPHEIEVVVDKEISGKEMTISLEELGIDITIEKNPDTQQVKAILSAKENTLEPLAITMIPRALTGNHSFGNCLNSNLFVSREEYENFLNFLQKATGKNGNLDGLRTRKAFLDIEGVGEDEGNIFLSISV